MILLNFLKKNISTRNTVDEIINVFEEMCKTPIEDDLLLHEYGVYAWTGEPLFYYDLVRQYPDGEGEYCQLRVSIMFEPIGELSCYQGTHWSDDTDEDFLVYIRKLSVYESVKNNKIKDIEIRIDQT